MKKLQLEQNSNIWIAMFTQLSVKGVPALEQIRTITADDVRFCDPFNKLHGPIAIHKLFEHTLKKLPDVRFKILDKAQSGSTIYIKWEMHATIKKTGKWQVNGMSEMVFDESGRLKLHQDYWDAAEQFYEQLPILGWLLKKIRSKLSIS